MKNNDISIGSLVEIIQKDDDCYDWYSNGVRLFVVRKTRDCDGTILYNLSPDRNETIFKEFRSNWYGPFDIKAFKAIE